MDTFYILIPTYNPTAIFLRCLISCLEQSYEDLEVIVSDDSDCDLAIEIINDINSNRITYRRNNIRKGAVQNWNSLLSAKYTGYVKLLHQDEYFCDQHAILSIVEQFNSAYAPQVVINSHHIVDRNCQKLRSNVMNSSYLSYIYARPYSLLLDNRIGSPSNISFRSDSVLLYDTSLRWYVDVDSLIGIFRSKTIGFVSAPVVSSVSGCESQISRAIERDYALHRNELIYILDKYKLTHELSLSFGLKLAIVSIMRPVFILAFLKLFQAVDPAKKITLILLLPLYIPIYLAFWALTKSVLLHTKFFRAILKKRFASG